MKRKHLTTLQRAKLFLQHDGKCHLCGNKIDGVHEAWEVEHVIALVIGGADDVSNMAPAHKVCHRRKTDADVTAGAKVKRIQARHIGAKGEGKIKSRGFGQWVDNTKQIHEEFSE